MLPTPSGRTFARRRDLNGEVSAWDMAYGTSPTASEPPRNLSDLRFPLLRSWQKPRFLPAETKLMSDKRAGARLVDRRSTRRVPSRDGMAQKAPQATFSNELEQLLRCKRSEQPQQQALRMGVLGLGIPLLHRAPT